MKFEAQEIVEFPEFLSPVDNSLVLGQIFNKKKLWENRKERVPEYKNSEWFTLGANSYLDVKEDWDSYQKKVEYFNEILTKEFSTLWPVLAHNLKDATGEEFDYAWKLFPHFANPGFHIFPPHESMITFFGRDHKDLQWKYIHRYPQIDPQLAEGMTNHFSGTYCLALPKQGPHFLFGEKLEMGLTYKERAMYLHSGQFNHAIAPLKMPVTRLDWRITLQFHGFEYQGKNWIYW